MLFVDYMAEHLTAGGRAGIIVPEGIIFQSQNAYKKLRKMLVEEYLVAVVSLPAGVFQPYSGVKTSILILDKARAGRSDSIGFFKVEHDGYALGAQRRPIEQDDLPEVAAAVREYRGMDGQDGQEKKRKGRKKKNPVPESSCASCPSMLHALVERGQALVVAKEKIAENGEYNLSGERYREVSASTSDWPLVPVGDIFRKSGETVQPASLGGPVTYVGLENITQQDGGLTGVLVVDDPSSIKSTKNTFAANDILYGKLRPNLNKVWLSDRHGICSTDIFVVRSCDSGVVPALYAYIFRGQRFNEAVMSQLKGAQLPRVGWQSFTHLRVPLPPLEVQKEIVAEIEGYQKVIDGARAVLDNYRPHIPINPDWPVVEIGTICTIVRGSSPRPQGDPQFFGGPVPRLMVADITRDGMFATPQIDSLTKHGATKSRPMKKGDVVITVSGNPGLPTILAIDACIHDGFVGLRELSKHVQPEYLYFALLALHASHSSQSVGAVFKNLTTHQIRDFKIALPDLATQQTIVAEIEAEQALVNANRELIDRFEKKIQATIARIWGDEDDAKHG